MGDASRARTRSRNLIDVSSWSIFGNDQPPTCRQFTFDQLGPRASAEATRRRRARRRDGPRQVVEHQGPARAAMGAAALRRGLPRTHYFAQARSVFAVAAHRCDEVFNPPDTVTLWRLPASDRGAIRRPLGALAGQRGATGTPFFERGRTRSTTTDRRGGARSVRPRRATADIDACRGLGDSAPGGRSAAARTRSPAPRADLDAARSGFAAGRAARSPSRTPSSRHGMTLSDRADVVSSFTIIKGTMIEETYAVFAAWDFDRVQAREPRPAPRGELHRRQRARPGSATSPRC